MNLKTKGEKQMSKVKRNNSKGFSKSSIDNLDLPERTKQALRDHEAGDYMAIMRWQIELQQEEMLERIQDGTSNLNWD